MEIKAVTRESKSRGLVVTAVCAVALVGLGRAEAGDRAAISVRGGAILLGDPIQFVGASSKVNPRCYPALQRLADLLRATPSIQTVRIGAHTATGPSATSNLSLSERRANAVKAQLMAMGIAATRLQVRGYGDQVPVATNQTREGRALNQRVEVTIVASALGTPGWSDLEVDGVVANGTAPVAEYHFDW